MWRSAVQSRPGPPNIMPNELELEQRDTETDSSQQEKDRKVFEIVAFWKLLSRGEGGKDEELLEKIKPELLSDEVKDLILETDQLRKKGLPKKEENEQLEILNEKITKLAESELPKTTVECEQEKKAIRDKFQAGEITVEEMNRRFKALHFWHQEPQTESDLAALSFLNDSLWLEESELSEKEE